MSHQHKYKATVNKQHTFDIDQQLVNKDTDMVQLSSAEWHLLRNKQSFNIRLVSTDADTKTLVVRVNGTNYSVALKDETDLLLETMGITAKSSSKTDVFKAPMPGLILAIKVNVGDTVKKGDQLLILEAMKMENVLTAPHDGVVQSIEASQGAAVEKNAVLIKFA